MIVTVPYYSGGYYSGSTVGTFSHGYSSCRCTWTVCRCQQGDITQWRGTQWIVVSTDECAAPLTKQQANKKRMESIPRRAPSAKRMRLHAPSARPSIQALSMRIR